MKSLNKGKKGVNSPRNRTSIYFHSVNDMDFFTTVKGTMSIPWHHFLPSFSLALLFAAPAHTGDEAKKPIFTVQTTRGDLVKGNWRQLKPDWSVRIGEADGTLISGSQVLSVRRADGPLPPLPMENHLILANGDRIPFRDLRLIEEKFHFRHVNLEDGKDAVLPLSAVSVLWYIAPDKNLDAEKLRRRLTSTKRTRDTVCLRNGDIVAGILTSLDAENTVVEVDKRRVTVKTPQLAYIAFNTELADYLRPKGTYARLILCDNRPGHGGRISFTAPSADESTLTGTTVFGARLRVPLRDVAALEPNLGNSIYLSELKESKYSFQPFLDSVWPFTLDGNVAGHDLLLAGSTYDKGIGMHSQSRLSYRLSGAYRRFEATAGLDDKDGRGGAVRLRVLVDGRTLLDRTITSRDGAVPISLSVEGVREMTLEVDFGRDGDVRDVVDWADARLVR
jgi:NPCBM/NEW2 domain-containing protein